MTEGTVRPVTVERLRPDDDAAIAAARDLLATAFGSGGYPSERMKAFANDASTLVACAWLDSTLVGVAVARTTMDLRGAFGTFGEPALERLRDAKVGVLESGTVATSFRGRGIGRDVTRWLMQWLREQKCTLAVAASWNSGGAQTSRPVLERLGFRAIAESSSEVYRLTNLNGRPCPVCGAPCRCTGTLFVLPLEAHSE